MPPPARSAPTSRSAPPPRVTPFWSYRRWPEQVAGVIAGDGPTGPIVVSQWSDGELVALDARTGRVAWRAAGTAPDDGYAGRRTGASTVYAPPGLHLASASRGRDGARRHRSYRPARAGSGHRPRVVAGRRCGRLPDRRTRHHRRPAGRRGRLRPTARGGVPGRGHRCGDPALAARGRRPGAGLSGICAAPTAAPAVGRSGPPAPGPARAGWSTRRSRWSYRHWPRPGRCSSTSWRWPGRGRTWWPAP